MAPKAEITSGGSASPVDGGFAHGFAHCQGKRPYMEDEVMTGVALADGVQLWAVFDGHAGRKAVWTGRAVAYGKGNKAHKKGSKEWTDSIWTRKHPEWDESVPVHRVEGQAGDCILFT